VEIICERAKRLNAETSCTGAPEQKQEKCQVNGKGFGQRHKTTAPNIEFHDLTWKVVDEISNYL
jgi:hypothetical protein